MTNFEAVQSIIERSLWMVQDVDLRPVPYPKTNFRMICRLALEIGDDRRVRLIVNSIKITALQIYELEKSFPDPPPFPQRLGSVCYRTMAIRRIQLQILIAILLGEDIPCKMPIDRRSPRDPTLKGTKGQIRS